MATCMYDQSIDHYVHPPRWHKVGGGGPSILARYDIMSLYIYILARWLLGCFRVCEAGATKVMHCVFKVLNIPNIRTYIWPLLGGSWLLSPLIDLQQRAQPWARGVKVVHWNFEHHIPPFSLIYIWATCWCGCLLTLPNVIFCCKDFDDPQWTRGIVS